MRALETFRGLYIDLSGLDWDDIDSERSRLRYRHPFLPPNARFIYSHLTTWKPPTRAEFCRREREIAQLRYPEESATRENPLRVGTKRIKIKGVEYPFIAVSDHWRNSLLHENRLVWIHHYRGIQGLRPSVYKVYYATKQVPYNRLPWTVDNTCSGNEPDGAEFSLLEKAIECAMIIAESRGELANIAASELGYRGGIVRSERKSKAAQENGRRGGRKRLELNVDEI